MARLVRGCQQCVDAHLGDTRRSIHHCHTSARPGAAMTTMCVRCAGAAAFALALWPRGGIAHTAEVGSQPAADNTELSLKLHVEGTYYLDVFEVVADGLAVAARCAVRVSSSAALSAARAFGVGADALR